MHVAPLGSLLALALALVLRPNPLSREERFAEGHASGSLRVEPAARVRVHCAGYCCWAGLYRRLKPAASGAWSTLHVAAWQGCWASLLGPLNKEGTRVLRGCAGALQLSFA